MAYKTRIVSPGGSGLKFLIKALKEEYKNNGIDTFFIVDENFDPHKIYDDDRRELIKNKINKKEIERIIVLMADPRNALISFFNRSNRWESAAS